MAPDPPSASSNSGAIGGAKSNSSIRVFVRWHEQVVFAGEEVKCTITFKNIARVADSSGRSAAAASRPSTQFPPNSSRHPGADRGPRQHSSQARGKQSSSGLAPPPSARGHRSTLSLSAPSAVSRARAGSGSSWAPAPAAGARGQPNGNANGSGSGSGSGNGGGGHGHKRSVSIVSIGSLSAVDDGQSSSSSSKPQRPRGHARASSLQILPRGGLFNGPFSGPRSGQLLGQKKEESADLA